MPQASDDIDVLVVGFPCNPNSMLNCKRFKTDATAEPDAQVLVATADLIRQCQPKVFVLENVDGINKKRGGQGAESDCTVLAWIMQVLRDRVGAQYCASEFNLQSYQLSRPQPL